MNKVAEVIWKSLMPRSPVFTTADVAAAANVRLPNASRDLSNLAENGFVTRIMRGVWAVTNHPDFSAYAVVPFVVGKDQDGYVSLVSALNLHGMIEQIPHRIHVMTLTQRPRLTTPVGTYEFHRLNPEAFGGHEPYGQLGTFQIASREKAVFDTLYISARRGQRFSHLPEVSLGERFLESGVLGWIEKISHPPLRAAVARRWNKLAISGLSPAA